MEGKKNVEVTFPVIEDIKMDVARKYGMVQSQSSTQAVRAVFIIDPKGIVRTILFYPAAVGRNFDEIKRAVQALQKADKDGVATPADWRPGDDVIIDSRLLRHRERADGEQDERCTAWTGSSVSGRNRKDRRMEEPEELPLILLRDVDAFKGFVGGHSHRNR